MPSSDHFDTGVRYQSSQSPAAEGAANDRAVAGRLEGQVAVVSGAASGIGRVAALLFAKEGCRVVATDIDEATGASIADEHENIIFERCDVSKEEEVARAVERAEQEFGKLTVMFNNAGVMLSDDGDTASTTESVWDTTLAINVKGVFYGCKHAIPAMRRAGGGSIINTASFVGKLGAATPQIAYTASKGAVLSLTRELSIIHAREGIRVNSLCPGPLNTGAYSI